jgi:hypothetical protein
MTEGVAAQTPQKGDNALPVVLRVSIHRDEAIWKLEVMSRRGRLPGFRRTLTGCEVSAHGQPFDKVMHLHAADGIGKGAVFTPSLRLERRMPAITAVIFVLVTWPGVLLTDSFMRMHLAFYDAWTTQGLKTWWWYVPLCIISLVWAWFGAIKKSHRTATASARETLDKIAAELHGVVEPA